MLRDIVEDFVIGKRVVVTSSTNNGASSLSLFTANTILKDDKIVIIYNPSGDIDREFVKKYYPRVYNDALWITSPLNTFLEFLQFIQFGFDCLIIDPGDVLMVNKKIVEVIGNLRRKSSTFLCTSQIRQDPNKGWAPYSTIERVGAFDYSIWITNVSGEHVLFKKKYIDIHKDKRSGNNFIAREIAKFTDEGNIVE